ncbi:MAG: hypothetical protein JWL77_6825 [Chthonomonadaceae bacterium]|nr:hypothetical protein [Chthonomonadaceae bacterium]
MIFLFHIKQDKRKRQSRNLTYIDTHAHKAYTHIYEIYIIYIYIYIYWTIGELWREGGEKKIQR